MFSWINETVFSEKDLITSLLKNCRSENIGNCTKTMLANISEGLCQPLKVCLNFLSIFFSLIKNIKYFNF